MAETNERENRPADCESTPAVEARDNAAVSPGGANAVPEIRKKRPCGKRGRSGPPGNSNARTHGHHALKRAVSSLGSRAIDRRTAVGRALAAWRHELLADLGGVDNVSTQELALVEQAVRTKLLLDSVDAWLLEQRTLVNKRSRALIPVVRDRNGLVATLRALLGDLGLKRRKEEPLDVGAYLANRAARRPGAGPTADAPDQHAALDDASESEAAP